MNAGPAPGSAFGTRDTDRLFQGQSSSAQAGPSGGASAAQALPREPQFGGSDATGFGGGGSGSPNTLDEPLWDTISRDLKQVYLNLKLVVFPFGSDREQQAQALRNWDLWGPMVFTLVLASCLSIGYKPPSAVFSVVFAVVSFGSLVLTVNVVLLGGNIGFFQALCLLGYCLFPIDVAAIVSVFIKFRIIRWLVTVACVSWASWAALPFIGGSVPPARRALAVFPLLLLYTSLGWLTLVR
mmetsp:Transcript_16277/g.48805  ORF Transcript_16277/g.48805 Transcript_16277/m.48805 type:complete len:240 (+) Transcript_16277:184-903(+)|eukprot:CAMPEP_0206147420 /NCGR_PEP_ID=MMETSP1473-20131121/33401_1 /ASSEMBLY_ACC=CAM_ASM_001109 /TAXON_ID=1461547 /ORGANISM="Stichococcus sp, Strain RCC1054" /LENGTH=239 /DNA_ID=CAMNT_0053544341 /DNA_START=178 /DNA_END=897 /DNA_ORIENTATION=+